MRTLDGFRQRFGLAMAGRKNPWGNGGGNGSSGDGDQPVSGNDGPRNPWLPGGGGSDDGKRRSANIEDIFKNKGSGGGGGGGANFRMPERPGGGSWLPVIAVVVIGFGVIFSSLHQVEPRENAVVKTLGEYSSTLPPGLHLTMPFPFQTVAKEDVQSVRQVNIPGSQERAKLILTGDQNLVDLSYVVRWNITELSDFKFELVDPIETVNEVAEAAMRASVAEKTLDETFTGQGRAEIELAVRERMQEALNEYQSGIRVLGVEIAKADPPSEVVDAFRDVSVAEQNADRARNQARGYAQQVLANAEGESEAFTKVYEQYRLAPEVTRQRLYYETMERVLSTTDKTIIETEGVTPYLPLPEIRRRANQAPQPITATPSQTGGQ